MGQEIDSSYFRRHDFQNFDLRLHDEMQILKQWFEQGSFTDSGKVGGFELEAWLVDPQCRPAAINDRYLMLTQAQGLPVVEELALFNVELNGEPLSLRGTVLSEMHRALDFTWQQCNTLAARLDCGLVMMGILPTVKESELTLANMSHVKRYRALNDQILRLRQGRPLELKIHGRQRLELRHADVMLESAATSFQIHMKAELELMARYYNAAHIVSAPMVAIAANSPYLFGYDLWDETRIPLFEQAVDIGTATGSSPLGRVTFGAAYVESSLYECFLRNMENYPVLLPALMDDEPPEQLPHLRLHNGTIWRWNRPLIGFNEQGVPHLRLEHRVVPSGPTVIDMIANAALFFGLVTALSEVTPAPETLLSFETARNNFYAAAKDGLRAEIVWLDGKSIPMVELLRNELLPLARQGLQALNLDQQDIKTYLGVIEDRLQVQQNGAAWQRAFVARHGSDMTQLTRAYRERQQNDAPVHEWTF